MEHRALFRHINFTQNALRLSVTYNALKTVILLHYDVAYCGHYYVESSNAIGIMV